MKKLIIFLTVVIASTNVFAQSSKYSVGLVGTHFHNDSNENRISKAENPFGYGFIVTDKLTNEFSIAFSAEYLKGDLENELGEEKDARFHLSGIIHPFETKYVQPYIAGGFVFTHRMFEYNSQSKSDDTENTINGRLSLGVNVPIINNLFINGDLGGFMDGYGYVGWSSNIGFRLGL